jgi:hypothetical protein
MLRPGLARSLFPALGLFGLFRFAVGGTPTAVIETHRFLHIRIRDETGQFRDDDLGFSVGLPFGSMPTAVHPTFGRIFVTPGSDVVAVGVSTMIREA